MGWKCQIKTLARDFLLPNEYGEGLIKKIEEENPSASNDVKYRMAWRIIRSKLDEILI